MLRTSGLRGAARARTGDRRRPATGRADESSGGVFLGRSVPGGLWGLDLVPVLFFWCFSFWGGGVGGVGIFIIFCWGGLGFGT